MRVLRLMIAFCIFSVIATAADNPFIGTWKLNTMKSKGTPGTMSKEETVVFEADGNGVKRTVTGINADGEKLNFSGTVPWDAEGA